MLRKTLAVLIIILSFFREGGVQQISAQTESGGSGSGGRTGTSAVPMMCITLSVNGNTYTEYPHYYGQTRNSDYTFSSVNFGDSYIGGTVIASINIQNDAENISGTAFNLTSDPAIQISGADAASFSIIQPQLSSLAGGSNTTARIQFTPVSSGPKSAVITIPNNSPQKPDFSFTITGNVPENTNRWPVVYNGNLSDEKIACCLADSGNNLYLTGYNIKSVNDAYRYDWWVKKINSSGNEASGSWNKRIIAVSLIDTPRYAMTDNDDNIIVSSGDTTIKISPDGTEQWRLPNGGILYVDSENYVCIVTNTYDIYMYNSSGALQWYKIYGGTLKIDAANNILVYDKGDNSMRYLSQEGDECWLQTIAGFSINDAAFDSEGNIYIVGSGTNLLSASSGMDVWIKKYNSAGTEITSGWNKKFNWGYDTDEYAAQIFIHGSNIFVTGCGNNIFNAEGGTNSWIKQYASDGQELSVWNKVFENEDEANLIRIDKSGFMFFDNGSGAEAVIKRYSLNNVLLNTINYNNFFTWTDPKTGYRALNNDNYIPEPALMFDSSGDLYVSGYCSNSISLGGGDDWVIRKFSSAGVEQ